jgi:hypothetical protein
MDDEIPALEQELLKQWTASKYRNLTEKMPINFKVKNFHESFSITVSDMPFKSTPKVGNVIENGINSVNNKSVVPNTEL